MREATIRRADSAMDLIERLNATAVNVNVKTPSSLSFRGEIRSLVGEPARRS
jgi:hypothetical protein